MKELIYDPNDWPDNILDRIIRMFAPRTHEAFISLYMPDYIGPNADVDSVPSSGFALSFVESYTNEETGETTRLYSFGVYAIDEVSTRYTPWLYVVDTPITEEDNERYKGLIKQSFGLPSEWTFIDTIAMDKSSGLPGDNVGELPF